MADIWVYKKMGRLFAADADGEAMMSSLADGELVKANITKPRNGKRHRLLWVILTLVADNSETFDTPEQVLFALKVKLGYCDLVKCADGIHPMPRSISYAKMDDLEFAAFLDRVIDTICQSKWLQALPAEIRAEADLMMGINYQAANPRSHKQRQSVP